MLCTTVTRPWATNPPIWIIPLQARQTPISLVPVIRRENSLQEDKWSKVLVARNSWTSLIEALARQESLISKLQCKTNVQTSLRKQHPSHPTAPQQKKVGVWLIMMKNAVLVNKTSQKSFYFSMANLASRKPKYNIWLKKKGGNLSLRSTKNLKIIEAEWILMMGQFNFMPFAANGLTSGSSLCITQVLFLEQ